MKYKIILAISLLILLFPCLSLALEENEEYALAQEAVKSGDKGFAFIHFLSLAEGGVKTKHREEALFATAEYYFLIADYRDSFLALNKLLQDYPDLKIKPFALFYILRIAKISGNDILARQTQQEIINLHRLILLFKNTKEYKFKSPLGADYKIVQYINKIEFYLDGELQEQFSY
jgi:hypothetical protein